MSTYCIMSYMNNRSLQRKPNTSENNEHHSRRYILYYFSNPFHLNSENIPILTLT